MAWCSVKKSAGTTLLFILINLRLNELLFNGGMNVQLANQGPLHLKCDNIQKLNSPQENKVNGRAVPVLFN
jgi:hypothetical protein